MRPDHRGTEPSTPFWQLDRPFCTLSWQGAVLGVRLKGHFRHERYSEPATINPLGLPAGERSYLSIHPYLAMPDQRLRTAVSPSTEASRDDQGDDLGDAPVLLDATRWTARHEHWIGYGQAWYYPVARTIVLWELLPYDALLPPTPFADDLLPTLWRAFERILGEQFPDAEQIMTPAWEPAYDEESWQAFLLAQGYLPHPADDLAFLKPVSPKSQT